MNLLRLTDYLGKRKEYVYNIKTTQFKKGR